MLCRAHCLPATSEFLHAVAGKHYIDPDAMAMAAESFMNLSPWDYYLPVGIPTPTYSIFGPPHETVCHGWDDIVQQTCVQARWPHKLPFYPQLTRVPRLRTAACGRQR